jgi:hypothetical protein
MWKRVRIRNSGLSYARCFQDTTVFCGSRVLFSMSHNASISGSCIHKVFWNVLCNLQKLENYSFGKISL